jgi:hypothetical protein
MNKIRLGFLRLTKKPSHIVASSDPFSDHSISSGPSDTSRSYNKCLATDLLSDSTELDGDYIPRYREDLPPSEFKNSNKPILRLVLSNFDLHEMMTNFCKKEYTDENMTLWDAICKYNDERDYEIKKSLAWKLWTMFLSPESEVDINIKSLTARRIAEQMEMGLYDDLLFSELQHEVELLLTDSFVRFSLTKEYISYMNMKEYTPRRKSARTPVIEALHDEDVPIDHSLSQKLFQSKARDRMTI